MKTKKVPNRVLFLFGCIFALLGSFLLVKGMNDMIVSLRAEDWVSVPSTLETVVKEKHTSHGRHGSSTSYHVKPVYSYEYAGKTYRGKYIHPSYSGSNSDSQHALFKKLNKARQAHRKVLVRVNPENPEEAYLATRFDWASIQMPVFSLPFVAIGYGMLIWSWSLIRGRQKTIGDYLERRLTLPGH